LNTSETVIEKLDKEIKRVDSEVSKKITVQEDYDNAIQELIKKYKLESSSDIKLRNNISRMNK
ncbi:hypothetical protein PIROE2DRAFT_5811, partial [Piromyces sp. E2]